MVQDLDVMGHVELLQNEGHIEDDLPELLEDEVEKILADVLETEQKSEDNNF